MGQGPLLWGKVPLYGARFPCTGIRSVARVSIWLEGGGKIEFTECGWMLHPLPNRTCSYSDWDVLQRKRERNALVAGLIIRNIRPVFTLCPRNYQTSDSQIDCVQFDRIVRSYPGESASVQSR